MINQAVAAIIRQGNKVLLHQRSFESRGEPGKWENAGGAVDPGETPEAAIVREIKEELGVDFIIDKILFEDTNTNGGHTWHVLLYTGQIVDQPSITSPTETIAIQWFDLSELSTVDLASYTRTDFIRLGWLS